MKQIPVVILWHMHQPCYQHPVTGRYEMPWVYLHAIKDYGDMLQLAIDSAVPCTFNLVPSMVAQLEAYANGIASDRILDLIAATPETLFGEERSLLTRYLFYANETHMIAPLRRYAELLERKKQGDMTFDHLDLGDLQVLFLLAWCGNTLQKNPIVKALRKKGKGFTTAEKQQLFAVLREYVASILPLYQQAVASGLIEVSTTPYYHPILPLLFDMPSARIAMPSADIPIIDNQLFRQDAYRHIDDAIEFMQTRGFTTGGFWPSEGSVSPTIIPALRERGVTWIATDEGVLARSRPHFERADIYYPYNYQGMNCLFRDRELSDLVGFTYSSWMPEQAAADLMRRLSDIASALPDGGMIPIILDGENAWEYYADNGRAFFQAFYAQLQAHPTLVPRTVSQALQQTQLRPLEQLHSGSWINASFSTWVGHPEKNRAWELLNMTRTFLHTRDPQLNNPVSREALMRAEGSDWFWWLGDDHYTELGDLFDELFREYLIVIYREQGATPPSILYTPIRNQHVVSRCRGPVGKITPIIDGDYDSFFAWLHAGVYDLSDNASMHRQTRFQAVHYGYNGECNRLYLLLQMQGGEKSIGQELTIEINGEAIGRILLTAGEHSSGKTLRAVIGTTLEFEIRLDELPAHLQTLTDLPLAFVLHDGSELVERAPSHGNAVLEKPQVYELTHWIV